MGLFAVHNDVGLTTCNCSGSPSNIYIYICIHTYIYEITGVSLMSGPATSDVDARDGVNNCVWTATQHNIMRWDNVECDVRDIDKWVCLDYAARDDLFRYNSASSRIWFTVKYNTMVGFLIRWGHIYMYYYCVCIYIYTHIQYNITTMQFTRFGRPVLFLEING